MNRDRGLTLAELIVAAAISLVIMAALVMSFIVGRQSFLSADAYIQVQEQARRGLDAMVKELRETSSIDTELTIPNGDTPPGGAAR